jgi:hypothetical protein
VPEQILFRIDPDPRTGTGGAQKPTGNPKHRSHPGTVGVGRGRFLKAKLLWGSRQDLPGDQPFGGWA